MSALANTAAIYQNDANDDDTRYIILRISTLHFLQNVHKTTTPALQRVRGGEIVGPDEKQSYKIALSVMAAVVPYPASIKPIA